MYVVLDSFLSRDGWVLSVAVYPTEFGLERMKHEEMHGPATDVVDEKKEDNVMRKKKMRTSEMRDYVLT